MMTESCPCPDSCWRKGPLPPNTWFWGGLVLVSQRGSGFYLADFCGDHAKIVGVGGCNDKDGQRVEADQVAWFNNCLTLPPQE